MGKEKLFNRKSEAKKRIVSKINIRAEKAIQRLIIDKAPDQLKMVYALWARKTVMGFIVDKAGVKLAIRRW